jgi:hypothetical protein
MSTSGFSKSEMPWGFHDTVGQRWSQGPPLSWSGRSGIRSLEPPIIPESWGPTCWPSREGCPGSSARSRHRCPEAARSCGGHSGRFRCMHVTQGDRGRVQDGGDPGRTPGTGTSSKGRRDKSHRAVETETGQGEERTEQAERCSGTQKAEGKGGTPTGQNLRALRVSPTSPGSRRP